MADETKPPETLADAIDHANALFARARTLAISLAAAVAAAGAVALTFEDQLIQARQKWAAAAAVEQAVAAKTKAIDDHLEATDKAVKENTEKLAAEAPAGAPRVTALRAARDIAAWLWIGATIMLAGCGAMATRTVDATGIHSDSLFINPGQNQQKDSVTYSDGTKLGIQVEAAGYGVSIGLWKMRASTIPLVICDPAKGSCPIFIVPPVFSGTVVGVDVSGKTTTGDYFIVGQPPGSAAVAAPAPPVLNLAPLIPNLSLPAQGVPR